jgi:hypothetical protein
VQGGLLIATRRAGHGNGQFGYLSMKTLDIQVRAIHTPSIYQRQPGTTSKCTPVVRDVAIAHSLYHGGAVMMQVCSNHPLSRTRQLAFQLHKWPDVASKCEDANSFPASSESIKQRHL